VELVRGKTRAELTHEFFVKVESRITNHDSRFMNLMRRCFECGQPLGKKDMFCPRCGAKQPRDPKRKWTGFPGLKVKIKK
jgi:rRNA maturation endonuclease Nob1